MSLMYGDRCRITYSPGLWSSDDALKRVGQVGRVGDRSGNGEGIRLDIPIATDSGYYYSNQVWLHPDCLTVIN